jgi:hypothetical protein
MKEIRSSDKVENRNTETPEKSQTQAGLTSKTSEGPSVLSQARKTANGPFRCDWCGKFKDDMRRNGPRICRDCWRLFNEKERVSAMSRKEGKHH